MRELTCQEVDEVSGGNPVLITIPAAGVIAGGIGMASYALSAEQITGMGLTLAFAQGMVTGVLSSTGMMLCSVPGGAAAGIPAIALAGIVDITNPLKSLE